MFYIVKLERDCPLESMETKQQINVLPRISADRPLNNSDAKSV